MWAWILTGNAERKERSAPRCMNVVVSNRSSTDDDDAEYLIATSRDVVVDMGASLFMERAGGAIDQMQMRAGPSNA